MGNFGNILRSGIPARRTSKGFRAYGGAGGFLGHFRGVCMSCRWDLGYIALISADRAMLGLRAFLDTSWLHVNRPFGGICMIDLWDYLNNGAGADRAIAYSCSVLFTGGGS